MSEKQNNTSLKSLTLTDNRVLVKVFWLLTFVILTAIGAQVEIPTFPVPFTLQTFFVLLAGAFLGSRGGAISMGIYLLLGAIGLPVFSGGASGFLKLIGPTGGYLFAFPIAAFAVGYLVRIRTEYWWIIITLFIGSLIIFTLGTIQLNYVYIHNWSNSLNAGFLIFSYWDILKIISAATIAHYYFRKVKNI